MPLYDYRCPACSERFSRWLGLTELESPSSCPGCGAHAIRLVSGCAFHRSESSRLADFDPHDARRPDFFRDPHNVGLAAKRRLRDSPLDLGSKLDEIVERGRTGQILDDVR